MVVLIRFSKDFQIKDFNNLFFSLIFLKSIISE